MAHAVPPLNHERSPEVRLAHKIFLNDLGARFEKSQVHKDQDMDIESLNFAASPAKSLPICRICLSDIEDDITQNPLVSPCHCKGTMNFIHIKCLKGWIDSKRETRTTDSTHSYQWTIIRCELCHVPYPMDFIMPNGRAFKLYEYEIP